MKSPEDTNISLKPYSLAGNRNFCNYCPGYCCYRLEGATLLLDATDINRLARHFKITDGEVRSRFIEGRNTFMVRKDGSCVFLSNEKMRARCTVHTARPQQCREVPYDEPCPYLESAELLDKIQPRIERSLSSGTVLGEGKEV